MAFHDKVKDGSMKQHTIITALAGTDATAHDAKVDAFNKAHNVFFNQSNSFRDKEGLVLVTVCLYADGAK